MWNWFKKKDDLPKPVWVSMVYITEVKTIPFTSFSAVRHTFDQKQILQRYDSWLESNSINPFVEPCLITDLKLEDGKVTEIEFSETYPGGFSGQ